MSRNATLADIRQDITDQADLTGAVGATKRYKVPLLNRWINQAIQRFRMRLSSEGSTHYLVSTTGTTTVGATSPFSFYSLDLSAVSPGVVKVYGIDITYSSCIYTLQNVPFATRNDYGGPEHTGIPEAFANYQTAKVALMPAPNQALAYVAWYLPVLTDLADDSDVFDGVSGWEEYIVWDVVSRMMVRDKYSEAYANAVEYRNGLIEDIIRSANRVNLAGGQHRGRDTLGERLRGGGSVLRRRPPFIA